MASESIFAKARELLIRGRWLKDSWNDGQGGFCVLGALGDVTGKSGPNFRGQDPRYRFLKAALPLQWRTSTADAFNDALGVKKDDILSLLKRAEELERAETVDSTKTGT